MVPRKQRVNGTDVAPNQLSSKPSVLSIRIPGLHLAPMGGEPGDSDNYGSQSSSSLKGGNSQDGDTDGDEEVDEEGDSGSEVVEIGPSKKRKRMLTVEPEAIESISTSIAAPHTFTTDQTVASKRVSQSAFLKLNSDEPWDTVKAQFLSKISSALDPRTLAFEDYDIKYYIVRVIPKPVLPLANENDYELMLTKVHKPKDHEVNVTIVQTCRGLTDNKENEVDGDADSKIKKKKVCYVALFSSINFDLLNREN
jgi:hypothetical protein